jgi:hypothetical protein
MAENPLDAPNDPHIPFCFGCSTQFDLDEHAPRFLSECAHSLCISCVLAREPPCCAFCEQDFDVERVKANVDETLTALVESAAAGLAEKERRTCNSCDDCGSAEALMFCSKCPDLVGDLFCLTFQLNVEMLVRERIAGKDALK